MASFFMAALKIFQGRKDDSPKGAPKDDKAAALPNSVACEEFEEYQQQLREEKVAQDRDKEAAGARDSAEQVPFHVSAPQHGRSMEVLAQGCDSTFVHHRIERDKVFAQRKAERATVRMNLLDKYHLAWRRVRPHQTPSPTRVYDERDDTQVHVAGGAVELPQDLAAMVHSEKEEENGSAGALAFLTKMREVELPALRDRALDSADQVKKCALM